MITHDDSRVFDRIMILYFETFSDGKVMDRIDTEHLERWIGENTDYECKGCGYTFSECICDTFEPDIVLVEWY